MYFGAIPSSCLGFLSEVDNMHNYLKMYLHKVHWP